MHSYYTRNFVLLKENVNKALREKEQVARDTLAEEQIYALAGRELAARVLGFNAFFTTTLARHLAALFKHVINIVHKPALPLKPNIYGLSAEKYRFNA